MRFELGNPGACFDVLCHNLGGSDAELSFLSILQHLLFIRDDPNIQ